MDYANIAQRDQHRLYIEDLRMQRSRSRSRSSSKRSIKRGRSVSARSMVPSLRYDGEARISRTAFHNFAINPKLGLALGASTYVECLITFSPTGLTFWGSNVNYFHIPLPNAAEIAALWERVKIEKVELTFTTDGTDHVGVGTAPAHSSMLMYLANDPNGPTVGGSNLFQVMQESSCKQYKVGGNMPAVKWSIRNPKYQRLIQYTSINSSYEPATGYVQSDTDIPHYGVRMGIPNAYNVNACFLNVSAKFFFHVKNLK